MRQFLFQNVFTSLQSSTVSHPSFYQSHEGRFRSCPSPVKVLASLPGLQTHQAQMLLSSPPPTKGKIKHFFPHCKSNVCSLQTKSDDIWRHEQESAISRNFISQRELLIIWFFELSKSHVATLSATLSLLSSLVRPGSWSPMSSFLPLWLCSWHSVFSNCPAFPSTIWFIPNFKNPAQPLPAAWSLSSLSNA